LLPTTHEHLQSYSMIDISVDTFPYAGTTTTCEALYCGVPVVTLHRVKLPNHAHNVGATLLSRIKGMQRFIATSEEDYTRIAVTAAADIPRLAELRKTLRPLMLASPLCDGKTFCRNLEETYHKLWKRFCATYPNPGTPVPVQVSTPTIYPPEEPSSAPSATIALLSSQSLLPPIADVKSPAAAAVATLSPPPALAAAVAVAGSAAAAATSSSGAPAATSAAASGASGAAAANAASLASSSSSPSVSASPLADRDRRAKAASPLPSDSAPRK